MTKLKKAQEKIRKKIEKIVTYYTYGDETPYLLLSDETIDKLLSLTKEYALSCLPKEKEIRYEELDTGIGIDRLKYDGQEREEGFNQAIKQAKERIKKDTPVPPEIAEVVNAYKSVRGKPKKKINERTRSVEKGN